MVLMIDEVEPKCVKMVPVRFEMSTLTLGMPLRTSQPKGDKDVENTYGI